MLFSLSLYILKLFWAPAAAANLTLASKTTHYFFDFNQCRPQKIMKKYVQNSISRVKFPAKHVPGVKKCYAIDGKRGKAVEVHFYEKLMKKITFIQFLGFL